MSWFESLRSSLAGISDEQAMWRVQAEGDHEAFAELVRRWEVPVRALCIRMTGHERDGEDLCQEAFVRVFARRDGFEQGRKFSTWLWRIALNLCHDRHRRLMRSSELSLDEHADGDGALALAATDPGPDEQLLQDERAGLVRRALLSLPETHRAVVVLREYEGLKLREIAEVLEIPEGTVKSRLADSLDRLARHLEPIFDEDHETPATSAGAEKESPSHEPSKP